MIWLPLGFAAEPEGLVGCWEGAVEGGRYVERWEAPSEGGMRGESAWISQSGEVEGRESLRIDVGDGAYTPVIDGVERRPFRLDAGASGGESLVWRDRLNVYPRQLRYTFLDADTLRITLRGWGPTVVWEMERVECPA